MLKWKQILIRKLDLYHILKRFGADFKDLSLTENRKNIYFNTRNWMTGGNSDFDDIDLYRTYLVNHEVGHTLGYDHPKASSYCKNGRKASVMLQQTKGQPYMTGCKPWPYVKGADLGISSNKFQGGESDGGNCSIL